MMSGFAIVLMALVSLYAIVHLVKYVKYMKPAARSNKPCYEIKPEEGSVMSINDSGYIIKRIGYFIGQESKNGMCKADIKIDLRYASTSSIYRAIGVLESDGAKVKEMGGTPTALVFNIDWAKTRMVNET